MNADSPSGGPDTQTASGQAEVCTMARHARILGIAVWGVFALGALIRGILLPYFGVLVLTISIAIGSIVFGILALVSIWRSNGRLRGKGSAIAGIYVSSVYIICVWIAASMLAREDQQLLDVARKVRCSWHVKRIAEAVTDWQWKHDAHDRYPPSLQALHDDGLLTHESYDKFFPSEPILLCPATDTKPDPGKFITDYECILDRAGFTITESMEPSRIPFVWDKPGNHADGFHVARFDTVVEFIQDDERGSQRRQLLKKVDAWLEKHRPKGQAEQE